TTTTEGGSWFVYATGSGQANGANNTAVLAKYDAAGNLVWIANPGDTGYFNNSGGNGVTTLNGSIYVSGGTHYPYTDPGANHGVLWKYDDAGNQQWMRPTTATATYSRVTTAGGALYAVGYQYTGGVAGSEDYL